MEIIKYSKKHCEEAINLVKNIFNDENAVEHFNDPKNIALIAIENNHVIGLIGAIPQYGITGWELHPLCVHKNYQRLGYGSKLIQALEKEVVNRGGLMIYLGSDDEDSMTSLSDTDLYEDTFEKIKNIKNIKNHPYEFYEKQGYKIIGVFPDANGIGKPDIFMAKRLK